MDASSPPGSPTATAFLTARPIAIPSGAALAPAAWVHDWQPEQRAPVLSIIVPTYNERENVSLLLALLHEHLAGVGSSLSDKETSIAHLGAAPGPSQAQQRTAQQPLWWEVVFVDDNSPDGTAEEVRRLQTNRDLGRNVHLVQRPGKLGLGTAYMAGLREARGTWIALMDADLSHHPKYLPLMLHKQALTGCDIVSGTRYCAGGGVSGWDWKRKLTSRGANLLAQTLLGARQSDLTGAYRLYRRTCIERLLPSCTCRGYAFQMEVAVRAQYMRYRVEEVPIVFVDRLELTDVNWQIIRSVAPREH